MRPDHGIPDASGPAPEPMMNFRVSCQLDYWLHEPSSFLFALRCTETGGQQVMRESLLITPLQGTEEFSLCGGMNRFTRIRAWQSGPLGIVYEADARVAVELLSVACLPMDDPGGVPAEAVPFLFPSRYCESDRLRQFSFELFGHLQGSYAIASAISDWLYQNIAYVSGSSGESCSALDTVNLRRGVCRDFAHLGIALCRAMSIPARYLSCYAYQLNPPDFHACFEVYLSGWWVVFDGTRLAPLNGLVRIATGRDAADTAVCTILGNPELHGSQVSCFNTDAEFVPITRDSLAAQHLALALL